MPDKLSVDDRIDLADTAIGGAFTVRVKDGRVNLCCDNCPWEYTIGEMPLWELVCDAREHWQDTHA